MDLTRRQLLSGASLGLLGLLGSGCGAIPLLNQLRPETRRIGCPLIVSPVWPPLLVDITSDLAVTEGKNLRPRRNFVWGLADGPDELADLVAGQVREGVDLLMPIGTLAIRAAVAATTTIPIVGVLPGDLPDTAVIERLIRPGGNLTVAAVPAVPPERHLELLRRARPDARRVGLLWRPDSTWPAETSDRFVVAAGGFGLEMLPFELNAASGLEQVVGAADRAELSGLLLLPEWLTNRLFLRLVELAAAVRLPLIAPYRRCAALGALLTLGPNLYLLGRDVAELVGKVLDGASPGRLPLRKLGDTDLAVNPIVAHQVGFTLPKELLMQANEVVEE